MANVQVDINNKTGTKRLYRAKEYTVSNVTFPGYATDATFNPPTFTPSTDPTAQTIQVTAGGTLTLTVTDDVTPTGDPIDLTDATITRVDDANGTNTYVAADDCIVKDTTGDKNIVVINYLPFVATTGTDVFIKITVGDYGTKVFPISMNAKAKSETVTFPAMSTTNFTLADAKYTGAFPIGTGAINLTYPD